MRIRLEAEDEDTRVIKGNDSNSTLPQELLDDILSRLPYKSLLRFKSVCKSWYALFNDRLFLSLHLSNFMKNHTSGHTVLLRLSFPTIFGHGMENYKLFSLSSNDSNSVDTFIMPKINMLSTKFQISGQCNGILCLSVGYWPRSKEVILYNPATREFKCVPDSVMRLKSSFALAVGLGYDPQTDDFKVVRIWSVDTGVYTTNRVEEYALSTDSWTRMYNTNARDFVFGDDCFALFFKGTYYWWALKHRDESSVILGMDIGDEVFNIVSVPDHVDISKPNGRSLAVWRESLALICCSRFNVNTCVDIWVMMDGFGGEGSSWSKMKSVIVFEEAKPLVFWRGNELLMEMCSGKINSYNVDNEEIENVKMEGNPVRYSSQAVNYVATLVSIKGDNYLT